MNVGSETDTVVWTGLSAGMVYDVRARTVAYSDVLDDMGNATGWVYSDWAERQLTTGDGVAVPAPTQVQVVGSPGPNQVSLRATRTDDLAQHRALRMHFYLKPASKEAWDDQASPGGSAGGSDSPMTEGGRTNTADWTNLEGGAAYDVRVRVAAYSDVLDSNGDPTGWVYSDWVERQATASVRPPPPPPIPTPTDIEFEVRSTMIKMTATRIQSLRTHREFRMHFYLKPASKTQWDYQSAPGGDPDGTDSPIKETGPRDTASWSGLTADTAYDVRVRAVAYSDAPHEDGGVYGWRYSPWVEHEVTTNTGLRLPTTPMVITEGDSASYEISLLTAPTADVTVTVTSDNPDVTINSGATQPTDQNTLSFTPNSWDAAQTVIVSAAEDEDLFAETVTLSHVAESADTNFDIADAGSVTLTVADNDACLNTMDEGLLSDCKALLDAREDLRGTAALNWSPGVDIGDWEGVTVGVSNRVTKLDLTGMNLSGIIPAALGNLSVLEVLRLHENALGGTIPPELGRLTQLTTLWLSGNQISGSLPAELADLSSLEDLQIYNNELSGDIPSQIGRLASLTTLRLSGNQLAGEIPSALGDLANLEVLRLHGNRLTGSIPAELTKLANLERLYLNDNELNGAISPDFGNLTNLERLYLYDNKLTGAIPVELAQLKMLPTGGLRLYGNRLSGCIPAALASHESQIKAQQGDVNLAVCESELELSAHETGISMAKGTTAAYTVRLNNVPRTTPIAVQVTSDNSGVTVDTDATLPGDQNRLTFTLGNWNREQSVTVHACEDVTDKTATLSHTVAGADSNSANIEAGSVSFTVTVIDVAERVGPQLMSRLPDLTLEIGDEPERLDVGRAFSHPNGDVLRFVYGLDRDGIVAVSGDTVLTISALAHGAAMLTITATDPSGSSASQTVSLTVTNDGLRRSAERSLEGFGRSVIASVSSQVRARIEGRERGRGAVPERESRRTSSNGLSRSVSNAGTHALSSRVRQPRNSSNSAFLPPVVGAPNPHHSPQGTTANGLDQFLSMLPGSFDLNLNGLEGGGAWALWGARDRQAWNGDGHDGSVSSVYLGLDYQVQPNWMVGVSVARSGADSRYRHGWASQEMDVGLTTVLPYVSYRTPNDKTSIWGVAGVGSGTLDSTVVGADVSSSALDMSLYMVGGRHRLARLGGLNIALIGDLAVADLESVKGDGAVDSLDASVSRIRAGLDFRWAWQLADAVSIAPSGELSVRRDDGIEGAGTGLEFLGGVRVTKNNFRLEAKGRTLLVHSVNHYSESGYTLLATFAPGESGKGLTVSLGSEWGALATDSGMMWGERMLTTGGAFSNDDDRGVTWSGHVGYGVPGLRGRFLLTPFVDTKLSESQVRGIRLGTQITRLVRDRITLDMDLALGGSAREHVGMDRELSIKVQARF